MTGQQDILDDLRAAALAAAAQHWAPYSNFQVLAAVRTLDGSCHGGSNVENANFSLTVHAEQNAIMAALAAGALTRHGRACITHVYVTCPSQNATPCGSCRQAIREFAAPGCEVISQTADGTVRSMTLSVLLPEDFGPEDLGV